VVVTREHFFNADFDLSLRPGWSGPGSDAAARRIRDLAFFGVAAAGPGESVMLHDPLPDASAAVLAAAGVEPPAVTLHPDRRPGSVLSPFGWNQEAIALDRGSERSAGPPALEIVRRVNDRRFADRVAAEVLGEEEHVLGAASDVSEVAALVCSDREHDGGWVVKARHANAALGNRRLRSAPPGGRDLDAVAGLVQADGVVTVERWRPRLLDLSATFEVDGAGAARDVEVHEVVNTADGAFLGALFGPDGEPVARWREAVVGSAETAAAALADAGYRGPVCLDAFVWRSPTGPRLRRLVELNARRSMSSGSLRLWRLVGEDTTVYGRLFSMRRLTLPADAAGLAEALGEAAFDRRARRGALVLTPPSIGGRRPQRLGIAFVGRGRDDVLRQERRFRRRFER